MMMIPPASTIKASDNIPFRKPLLNIYLNVDPNADLIQTAKQYGPTKPWKEVLPIVKAIKGSSLPS